MALQLGALRDALIDAGASEAKAQRAAEELAGYEREFAAVRGDIAGVRSDFRTEIADVKADIRLLKWAQATTLAGVVAILLKLFIH